MGDPLFFDPWAFVCLVSVSGSAGAVLATRFRGVTLTPDRFLMATAFPALLAIFFAAKPIPADLAFWTFMIVVVLSALSVMDAATRTVPDLLTVPMIIFGVIHAKISGYSPVMFGGFALAVIALGLAGQYLLREQTWIGGGDILLVAGAVAWFGPALLPDLMLVTGVLLLVRVAIERLATPSPASCVPGAMPKDTGIPLAPSLGAAQLLIWFGGPLI